MMAATRAKKTLLSNKGISFNYRTHLTSYEFLNNDQDDLGCERVGNFIFKLSLCCFSTPQYTAPVSYTHLDVYKRQE